MLGHTREVTTWEAAAWFCQPPGSKGGPGGTWVQGQGGDAALALLLETLCMQLRTGSRELGLCLAELEAVPSRKALLVSSSGLPFSEGLGPCSRQAQSHSRQRSGLQLTRKTQPLAAMHVLALPAHHLGKAAHPCRALGEDGPGCSLPWVFPSLGWSHTPCRVWEQGLLRS